MADVNSGAGGPMRKSSKRKKKQYWSQGAKHARREEGTLQPGLKGFLCTCNKEEKRCLREAYALLNEYADTLHGPENQACSDEVAAQDVMDDLDCELADLQTTRSQNAERRFQGVTSRVNNCVFIKTTLEDPVQLAEKIFTDLECSRQQKSRHLIRMIPVEVTCKAEEDDIRKAASELFDKHFKGESRTYTIQFKTRNNNSLRRSVIIPVLADLVKSKSLLNRVDLRNAECTIMVEIIQKVCCLSVIRYYSRFYKYNLIEVATGGKNSRDASEKGCKAELNSGVEAKSCPSTVEESSATLEPV